MIQSAVAASLCRRTPKSCVFLLTNSYQALDGLAAIDDRKARVVEMRFFGGMTVEETADALGVSIDTVKRDWRLAKLWLLKTLKDRP